MLPKFGRRAGNEDEGKPSAHSHGKATISSSGGEKTPRDRPADRVVYADKLRSVDDDVDRNTSEQATKRAVEEKERIVRSVADAPVGYTVSMPKLTELDISNVWNEFLQSIHQEVDMSALTSCLVQKLDDEDVPWNPDMLLVQLTSDMLDAADALDLSPVAGKKGGGAGTRRRNLAMMEEPEIFESVGQQGARGAAGPEGAAGPSSAQAAGDSAATAKGGAGARPSPSGGSQSGDGKREKGAPAQNPKAGASKGGKSPTKSDTKTESQTKERRQTSSSSTRSKSDTHASSVKESPGSAKKKK